MTEETKAVLIQYIGKQPRKLDNVQNSGRVWKHPGHAIPVPVFEKHYYLRHPTIWRETSAEQYALEQDGKSSRMVAAREVIEQLDDMGELREVADMLATRRGVLAKRAQIRPVAPPVAPRVMMDEEPLAGVTTDAPVALGAEPEQPTPPTKDQVAGSTDAAVMEAAAARRDKIKHAVKQLDPDNDEDYTTAGKPRVERVRAMTLIPDVTSEEIKEAMAP